MNARIKHDTVEFVRKMANGGMRTPEPIQEDSAEVVPTVHIPSKSELLVRQVHEETSGFSKLTESQVQRMSCIPGVVVKISKKLKKKQD